ncbi:uncharacterized protein LOC143663338 [Tamandua tetradactyla]|uniref:uncharacterized protein LOC143663338 n=1 Tax=Tamandua tetradactyla TaxID=48850 RepID=UPI004053EB87
MKGLWGPAGGGGRTHEDSGIRAESRRARKAPEGAPGVGSTGASSDTVILCQHTPAPGFPVSSPPQDFPGMSDCREKHLLFSQLLRKGASKLKKSKKEFGQRKLTISSFPCIGRKFKSGEGTETEGEGHVTTEDDIEEMCLQAKEHQGLPATRVSMAQLPPSFWTSNLQISERINFCVLSHHVFGILVWQQPQETKISLKV